ncbi:MAG: YabP/YqfC family sporulation protein [Oscillospiraceae bacterium]|jgi:sporulation protein YqfC|nr:YabP/YqfC family sporulation protein [Oscillospiraceae bacterium]
MARKRKSRAARTAKTVQNLRELPRAGTPHLEITGNKELLVDGCKGVVAYAEEEIQLSLGDLVLSVVGADLTMRTLRFEECAITGQIASVAFTN